MGETLLSLFIEYVLPLLGTLLLGGLGKLMLVGSNAIKAKEKTSKLAGAGLKVFNFAMAVVADLEVTLKPELAMACKDGVLTKAEITHLRDTALARLKAMLGTAGIAELSKVLGLNPESLDKYLQGQIERAVSELPGKLRIPTELELPRPLPAPA